MFFAAYKLLVQEEQEYREAWDRYALNRANSLTSRVQQDLHAAQERLEEQTQLYSREHAQHELTAGELARLRRQLRVLLRTLPSGEVGESSQRVTLEVRNLVCNLTDLPQDVLELICTHLSPDDRWALSGCCKALESVLSRSTLVWGDLHIIVAKAQGAGASDTPPPQLDAWLGRRCSALRTLRLQLPPGMHPPASMLPNCSLTMLELRGSAAFPEALQLPALRQLVLAECGLRELPPKLPQLRLLADLDASGASFGVSRQDLVATQGPLDLLLHQLRQPLSVLPSLRGLTRLVLSSCDLLVVPQQLPALTALADLDLSRNPRMSWGTAVAAEVGGEGWRPLAGLAALTALRLAGSAAAVPPGLTALQGLAVLEIGDMWWVGDEEAWAGQALGLGLPGRQLGAVLPCTQPESLRMEGLQGLASLTRLVLRDCELTSLPAQQLASLTRLRELDVSRNFLPPGSVSLLAPPRSASLRIIGLNDQL